MTLYSSDIDRESGPIGTFSASDQIAVIKAGVSLVAESGSGFIGGGFGDLTVLNYGSISSGSGSGIFFVGSNTGGDLIINDGFIGGKIGIEDDAPSAGIINNGTVNAFNDGVRLGGATSTLINTGTITSAASIENPSANYTVVIGGDKDLFTNKGDVEGSVFASGTNATIGNAGTIDGNVTFSSGANTFDGIGGTIYGNLAGGTGADTIDLSHQTITGTITGGGGADTIAFASASAGFTIDLGDGTAYGAGEAFVFSGFEMANGSPYADTITGDNAGNYIVAGAGNDVINAGGGADTVLAGPGVDTVMAGAGNDTLFGNGGADILQGNGGIDSLIGGAGADTLTGGAGADTFFYQLVTDSPTTAPDLITDFVHGTDKIDLSGLHLALAGEVKITSSGGLTFVTIDTDNDGVADMQINLTGTNVLTASDIVGVPAGAPTVHAGAIADASAVTIAHHAIAAALHGAAIDHGLYG